MITLIFKAQFYVTESYIQTFTPLASIPYKLNGHMKGNFEQNIKNVNNFVNSSWI